MIYGVLRPLATATSSYGITLLFDIQVIFLVLYLQYSSTIHAYRHVYVLHGVGLTYVVL